LVVERRSLNTAAAADIAVAAAGTVVAAVAGTVAAVTVAGTVDPTSA
jgi:hypothetical protein